MQNQIGIQFEIFKSNSESTSHYSNSFEDEKQIVEIDDFKEDPYPIRATYDRYLIYHNDKIKYTVQFKNEALKIVENEIADITKYYSKIDSVYKIIVSVQNDTYNICGHYEFQNIVVNKVFETFKIVVKSN